MTTNDQEQAKGEAWRVRQLSAGHSMRLEVEAWVEHKDGLRLGIPGLGVIVDRLAADKGAQGVADYLNAQEQALSDARDYGTNAMASLRRIAAMLEIVAGDDVKPEQLGWAIGESLKMQLVALATNQERMAQLSDARAALARIDAYDGPIGSTVAEIVDIARAALARLDALKGAGE